MYLLSRKKKLSTEKFNSSDKKIWKIYFRPKCHILINDFGCRTKL